MLMPAHRRHYLAAFMMDFATSAGYTIIPFYIKHFLGGEAAMIGDIAFWRSICYGGLCIGLAPVFLRLKHPLRWAGFGCISYGVITYLSIFADTALSFGLVSVAGLMGMALFWPSMQAWLGAEREPGRRAKRIAHYNIAWCMGLATGPLAAGPLYDVDYRLGFGLVLGSALVGAALVMSLPREEHLFEQETPDEIQRNAQDAALSERHLYATWLAAFVGWAMVGVVHSVYADYVDALVNQNSLFLIAGSVTGEGIRMPLEAATQYSWIAFTLYFSRAVMSLVMGHWRFWRHKFWFLAGLQLCGGGALYVLGHTHSLVIMALCTLVIGVNGAVSFFASLEYSVANRAKKGLRTAIHESTTGLGRSSGALIFGRLMSARGHSWPYAWAPVAVAAVLVLQVLLLQRPRRGKG